jgi:hypothetical protein
MVVFVAFDDDAVAYFAEVLLAGGFVALSLCVQFCWFSFSFPS